MSLVKSTAWTLWGMTFTAVGLTYSAVQPPLVQIVIRHQHYKTYYNPHTHEPDSVSWDLTPQMLGCTNKPAKRIDRFTEDPDIPDTYGVINDYKGSQYDRGHLFSYEDAACNATDRIECFYMSNMLPQRHSLNAGKWKSLETWCRKLALTQPLHIIAGGIDSLTCIGPGHLKVPRLCYKAILINGRYHCWLFPNNDALVRKISSLDSCHISTIELDALTDLKL